VKISEGQEAMHFPPPNWHPTEYRCAYQVHYVALSDRVARIKGYLIALFGEAEA